MLVHWCSVRFYKIGVVSQNLPQVHYLVILYKFTLRRQEECCCEGGGSQKCSRKLFLEKKQHFFCTNDFLENMILLFASLQEVRKKHLIGPHQLGFFLCQKVADYQFFFTPSLTQTDKLQYVGNNRQRRQILQIPKLKSVFCYKSFVPLIKAALNLGNSFPGSYSDMIFFFIN